MIDRPKVIQFQGRPAAVVRLEIPRDELKTEMAPAINEVLGGSCRARSVSAGPLFAHHLTQSNERFDLEVGFPVAEAINEAGRVQSSRLPGGVIAHSCHIGPYEELFSAWREFDEWFRSDEAAKMNLKKGATLFEVYATGPETTENSNEWRTELYQTLKD